MAKADWLFYRQPDELIFGRYSAMDSGTVKDLCRRARKMADRLLEAHRTGSALKIAGQLGVGVSREVWETAEGRILYLGECTLHPPQIRLNISGIRRLAQSLLDVPCREIGWQSEESLEEVTVAHELYHIVERRNSCPEVELAAHAFTRELLAMPFSPLLFHRMYD